ncbi:NADH-quinone oxidoreductase subunit NuoE [Lutibacter sp. B2]|nr:NADH-quinone oxidoreductase subunit NuoE [Lutibacter sp. B2]
MPKANFQVEIPNTENLPKEKFNELKQYIDGLKSTEGALIQILHQAQEIFGYLPKEVQLFVARALGMPGSEVCGVVSFYSYFTTEPVGKHVISVCMGTACFVRGADKIVDRIAKKIGIGPEETTKDGFFTLKNIRCIGACGLAPVVMVDDKVYGRVKEEDIDDILDSYRKEEA